MTVLTSEMSKTGIDIHYQPTRRMDLGNETDGELYWIQECLVAMENLEKWLENDPIGRRFGSEWYEHGEELHVPLNAFLLKGTEKTLLFDTHSLSNPDHIVTELEDALGGRDLDFVAPSHDEAPHAGGANRVLEAFPESTLIECTASGSNPKLHKHVYEEADALQIEHGYTIDLGGLIVDFVKPVFLDSAVTTWMYEQETETLFTVDSFGFPHHQEECSLFADEMYSPITSGRLMQYTGRSLQYLQYINREKLYEKMDEFSYLYQPEVLAPAHGNVIRTGNYDRYSKYIKENVDWIAENGTIGISAFAL